MVDPDSAGTNARVLLVLESPSRLGADEGQGSGMLSCDNNDQTAANVWQLHEDTGLRREWCLPWNIVPWFVGSDSKNAAAKIADIQAGIPYLYQLLDLLPHVQVVIAMGELAKDGMATERRELEARGLTYLEAPHPGPRNLNTRKGYRTAIAEIFERARDIVESALADDPGDPIKPETDVQAVPRLVLDVDVRGRPATFATRHERTWRHAVARACEEHMLCDFDPTQSRFEVAFAFRMPVARTKGEQWDLDNLIKPTLDAMTSVFGVRKWLGRPQVADDRVDRITASKRTVGPGEEAGATIRVLTIAEREQGED